MDNNDKVRIVRYTALSLRKYDQEAKDSATLQWGIRGNYPRITVYTSNNQAFKDNKPDYSFIITAPFDYLTLLYFIDQMTIIAKGSNGKKVQIDCLNTKVENGQRSNEKVVQATVVIGKDENGIVYIAALEDSKKKIKFELMPNTEWFKHKDQDGNIITDKAWLSKTYAISYIGTIRDTILKAISKQKVEVDVPKPHVSLVSKSTPPKDEPIIDESKLNNLQKTKDEFDEIFGE